MKNPFITTSTTYLKFENQLRAQTSAEKLLVLLNYLFPGIVVVILINVKEIIYPLSDLFGVSTNNFQFWVMIGVTFGWHICYPIFMLKAVKGYSWKEVFQALSMDRFSAKGFLVLTPLFFLLVCVVAVPYMKFGFGVVHEFLQAVPLFQIPSHSIFYSYETIYGFASWQLSFLFIGNFLGEEIYFRGYLMKKSSFLGKHNWWIHSILFTIYHLWQIPMTFSLGVISLSFGLLMCWRKNLCELILLHILINLVLPVLVQVL